MSFPTTSVLDTFSGTLGSWTTPVVVDSALTISSGQLASSVSGYSSGVWMTAFAADQEVFCDIPTVDAVNEVGFYVRSIDPGADDYFVTWFTAGSYNILRRTSFVGTSLKTGTQAFAAGDSLGASIVGAVITIYRKPSGGAWGAVDSVTDGSPVITGGRIGVSIKNTTFRLDNFGGGTIPVGNTTTFSVNF